MPVNPPPPSETAGTDGHVDGFVAFPRQRAVAYREAGYWTGRTVDSLLSVAATRWPDRVAVADPMGSHTYRELDELADQAAGVLAAGQLRDGAGSPAAADLSGGEGRG